MRGRRSITTVLIGVLYYTYNQWYNFLVNVLIIPMIGVTIIGSFYIVEGPNFLYAQKREKECLESLRTIAIYNNKL